MTIPIFSSLQGYDRRWLRGDIVAGLTVWAVLVPEALAYATVQDAVDALAGEDTAAPD